MALRVVATDTETGETQEETITDDFIVLCHGSAHIGSIQSYPKSGTVQLTVKGRKGAS